MTPVFTISDTETLILALPVCEWLLVSCLLSARKIFSAVD